MANIYNLTVRHVDTCLPCYVNDHCNGAEEMLVGVAVDRSTRVHHVRSALEAEVRAYGDKLPEDMPAETVARVIANAFEGTHPFKAWDRNLEPRGDDDGETCQSWFRFAWSPISLSDLDAFARGYVECAVWADATAECLSPEGDGQGAEDGSPDELTPASLADMAGDCQRFQAENAADLDAYEERGRDRSHAGHDFWLTRNGHGAGFWDRGMGDLGDRLANAARAYGNVTIYRGDDGMLHAF